LHTKGYAAPETKAAFEQARSLIERAESMGEALEDPLALFSVLYGFWAANYVGFNGPIMCDLAAKFLALAEKQKAIVPRMIGHRITGVSSVFMGDIPRGREHLDLGLALYDPTEHRRLVTRFGQDHAVATLSNRSIALWVLGYPEAARSDVTQALKNAREIGHAATLMHALAHVTIPSTFRGDYTAAAAQSRELLLIAEEKNTPHWKALGLLNEGCLSTFMGKASEAVRFSVAGITAARTMGSIAWHPLWFSYLARAYADLGQFDEARRFIGEAIAAVETTKEGWHEAEANRIAGEIELLSPHPDATKAESYFERALSVARKQQAKSWELRAAMSMARLWRGQRKRNEALDLLTPVYNWFTEGFDTLDLKEAKTLLGTLTA
jgi:predicted ATPase